MLIVIDCREKKLIQECRVILEYRKDLSHIQLEIKNLPLGDMIIQDDTGNEKIIVERKTLNDLGSSIIDGRYQEQSYRLNNCEISNHNIYYVIEGTYMSLGPRYNKSTIISAIVSLSYYKGFSINRTLNIKETAEWLILFAHKLQKQDKTPYYHQDNVVHDVKEKTPEYSSVCKRVKKDNITTDNIGVIMLMQIPSVSQQTATIIIEKYKTINNLIKALESDINAINDVHLITKNGSKRKINKTARDNVYKYLVSMKDNTIMVDTQNVQS